MRAADPTALIWAAVLCAGLALWAMRTEEDVRRRARHLVGGAGPVRGRSPLGRIGDAIAGVRSGRPGPPGRSGGPGRPDGPAAWVGRWLGRWTRSGRGTGRPGGRRGLLGLRIGLACWIPGSRAVVRRRVVWAGPQLLCLPVGGVLAAMSRSPVPVLAAVAAVPLVARTLRKRGDRAAAERRAMAVGVLCGTVAGDLRAGRPPHTALADAVEAGGWPGSAELGEAGRLLLSAARFGGDVPQALRAAARSADGAHGLAAVAACWQVAVDGGAGLAAALDRVAAALRAEADQRDDLRAQLAGPRSTAFLLALLPVFGLVLGTGLGAGPAVVLLHTPAGLCCLTAGGLLEWGGLAWTSRIIRGAEGAPARKPAGPGPVERGPA